LTTGLKGMAKVRKVSVIQGVAEFSDSHELKIALTEGGTHTMTFDSCIIAAGSRVVKLPFLPDDPRIIDSTGALELESIPKKMLCLGGGIIGLEMATVYNSLGAEITVVELLDQLIPGADKDIVQPLAKRLKAKYKDIMLNTKVTAVEAKDDGLWVTFEGDKAPKEPVRFDKILSAVGRRPNGDLLAAEKAGVHVDERGFIPADAQMRTNVAHIYAIGDIIGQPMLAHKATHEAHVAAEVVAGQKHFFEPACIPNVAYTDPEIAWVGLSEKDAKEQGIAYEKGVFPWAASGRALGVDRTEGITKLIFDPETHRLLGVGICGVNAGELIGEAGLAIEMGCDAEDIALTIHPHPTLSETVGLAAEVYEGSCTDLPPARKR
ncbi:MAG: dihydrolipoyl dehydrogenase, partial [Gammaproteobacteria bacterium]|nr:dihydrolipoyl dehydrogenase [Gammaproteobacteria bacterium]NNJ73218.1 dihydrolipoyl dehydrogenase [Enterobacterales bacterium]